MSNDLNRIAQRFLDQVLFERMAGTQRSQTAPDSVSVSVILVRASDSQFFAGFKRDRTPVWTRMERFAKRIAESSVDHYSCQLPNDVVFARHSSEPST